MPQITKLRIVNFQYPDVDRLIADELFDFENEDKEPSDVLINLENGGGKSVLVQLMLQPVIPRAKVAGRKIESFFTRTSDHCFVALEWALEGSKMRLMTGIALSAGDAARNPDEDRGFRIKYYTFLSSYQDYQGRYDIISLPLSRRERNHFIPASYEDVRNLAKKSGGNLERYASEDSARWKDRLAQYGIMQNEWKLIEELNSGEDGLTKYFSDLKSSDAVIDRLILPRIEERQGRSASAEDSSLETMLISYARQFSRQQEIIKERGICQGFLEMLQVAQTQTEQLWNDNNRLELSVGDIFAYADALGKRQASQEAETGRLAQTAEDLEKGLLHISWEQASAAFYTCREELERTQAELDRAGQAKDKVREKLEGAKKKLKILECAYLYGELVRIQGSLQAVSLEIADRESDSDSAARLASLKYSAFAAIKNELETLLPRIEEISSQKESLEKAEKELADQMKSLGTSTAKAASDADRAQAVYEKQMDDDDVLVEELGIPVLRFFDGRYPARDLDLWQEKIEKKLQAAAGALEETAERLSELDERREELPAEIADRNMEKKELEGRLSVLDENLQAYKEAHELVSHVLSKHGLDPLKPFSDRPGEYLQEKIGAAMAEAEADERKIEADQEAAAAAERGSLHIPKIISDFLDGTGISYTSMEKYILAQQEKGLLSPEACRQLLTSYPYAAYGIIVDEAGRHALEEDSQGLWLPAVLPVFTQEDLAGLFDGTAPAFSSLSAYARDYFRDRQAYKEKLKEDCQRQQEHLQLVRERKEALEGDLKILQAFGIYDPGWEKRTASDMAALKKEIDEKIEQIDLLRREAEQLKEAVRQARQKEKELGEQQKHLQDTLACYERLLAGLKREEDYLQAANAAAARKRELAADLKKKTKEKEDMAGRLDQIRESLKGLEELAARLQEGLEAVKDAKESPLTEGGWQELLTQYQELIRAQSEDLKRLNDEKNRLIKEREKRRREIKKRGCSPEEYEPVIYRAQEEEETSALIKELENEAEQASADHLQAVDFHARADQAFQNARQGLQPFGGEALEMGQIGRDFDSRRRELQKELSETERSEKKLREGLSRLSRIQGKTDSILAGYARPENYKSLDLEEDYRAQLDRLSQQACACGQAVEAGRENVMDSLNSMVKTYGADSADVSVAAANMQDILLGPARGDRYFTLLEHIQANMHTVRLRISQIDTDLEEFHKTGQDLTRQCLIQGRQMYEGLMQISAGSHVRIQGRRRRMLTFDIPDAVDEGRAALSISAEIDKGMREIAAKMAEGDCPESQIRKLASGIVGSRRLLRIYIGTENIVLKAYKIDRSPDKSSYRTWEQTQVNSSGAEKFVVYFAVILALMAYARDSYEDLGGDKAKSVLVLDNPFGPITSKHVVEPMFEISRHYNVQMICLSNISNSDIVCCFDLVIRAIVKRLNFGQREQLTHEGNEKIEHGFYRSEQIRFF